MSKNQAVTLVMAKHHAKSWAQRHATASTATSPLFFLPPWKPNTAKLKASQANSSYNSYNFSINPFIQPSSVSQVAH